MVLAHCLMLVVVCCASAVRRAVVVCPASLVNNWAAEITKWLQGRCNCTPVADSCREKVVAKFEGFKYDRQVSHTQASYAHASTYISVSRRYLLHTQLAVCVYLCWVLVNSDGRLLFCSPTLAVLIAQSPSPDPPLFISPSC